MRNKYQSQEEQVALAASLILAGQVANHPAGKTMSNLEIDFVVDNAARAAYSLVKRLERDALDREVERMDQENALFGDSAPLREREVEGEERYEQGQGVKIRG